ncbi:MAG: AAA family ATPase [Planctomycetes bacterium]|nr:AAA family ATPase [Planctomycetota bacterium]
MSGPEHRHHQIKRLEISGGGFLGDVVIDFADGLNCMIGGRGAGKTTVLEFLRYALDELPDAGRARAQRQAIEGLVDGNLKAGRLRVEIETQDGLTYHVERSAGERPEVLDEEGRATALTLGRGGFFGIEVYGQNEIERIANTPTFQLDLIDKFREEEVQDLNQRLRVLEAELGNNATEILSLSGQIEELEGQLTELPHVTERLEKVFRTRGQGLPAALERELTLKGLREQEVRLVRAGLEHLSGLRGSLEAQAMVCRRAPGRLDFAQVGRGPNRAALERVSQAFQTTCQEVHELLTAALERLARGAGEIEAAGGDLQEAHRQQDRQYQTLIQTRKAEQDQAREQLKLQRRQAELEEKRRELERKRQARNGAQARRRELTRSLVELRNRRTGLREAVVAFLNDRLSPGIRVSLDPCSDGSRYRQLLLDAFQGVGRPYRGPVQTVSNALRPDALAQLVRTDDRAKLAERGKITPTQADWFVDRLRGTRALLDLEVVELPDVPRIELLDGEYKDAPRLSTGQKCTTILPILLLESEKPLLIDEPEGNLDNAFVYDTVVRKLLDVKRARQLILVTHNPNIPVLGDAEQVVVLSSSGTKARVAAAGTVDVVKEHVETILEGGREAFEERRRRYGR